MFLQFLFVCTFFVSFLSCLFYILFHLFRVRTFFARFLPVLLSPRTYKISLHYFESYNL